MKYLIFFLSMVLFSISFAQDLPVDGDIVFTQIGVDNPERIEFVTLKRLNLSTLKVTDKGVESDGTLRAGEGTYDLSNTSWTDVPGGTFIRLGNVINDNDNSDRILAYDGTGSGTLPNLTDPNDQCIAYIGTTENPTYIAGIYCGTAGWNSGATGTGDSKAPGTLSDCDIGSLDDQYFNPTEAIDGEANTIRVAIVSAGNNALWEGRSSAAYEYQNLTIKIGNFALPVELTFFTALLAENKITLNWQTATEVNNYGFEIERSLNSDSWIKIGFVIGHGNCNSSKNYEFVDTNPPAEELEYRLKQIDTDGVFKYYNLTAKVNNSVTDIEENTLPLEFALEQNYPNPFNPTTVISYTIGTGQSLESSFVGLKVYDMLGCEVVTLVKQQQSAGKYTVNFNASNFTSGTYLYKLTAGDFVDVKKLLLIK